MRYRHRAICGLVGYVAAVELFAPPNELISHAFDDWLKKPPSAILASLVVLATAGHLLNLIPDEMDLYAYFGRVRIKYAHNRLTITYR